MSTPITEPGWYKLGAKGLERVAGLDDQLDDIDGVPHIAELVKVELGEHMTEEPLF